MRGRTEWKFVLYVAGESPRSRLALDALLAFGREHLGGPPSVEVVNVKTGSAPPPPEPLLLVPTAIRVFPEPRVLMPAPASAEDIRKFLRIAGHDPPAPARSDA